MNSTQTGTYGARRPYTRSSGAGTQSTAGGSRNSGAPSKRTLSQKRAPSVTNRGAAPHAVGTPRREYVSRGVAPTPRTPKETLRIIPIGGCEEVGRNMVLFEYEDDIVLVDMGLQFPEEDMPGIDYIIPNIKYLQGKEKNVRGVVFTHGHLDHIGAAPFLLEKLSFPPIVARDLTIALIKHKQEDYQKGSAKKLKIIRVNSLDDKVKLGKMTISFFQVEHSIMDAMGVCVETPAGTAIHPGDWTMERDKEGNTRLRYDQLASTKTRPTALLLESLGAVSNNRHGTYEEMYENLYGIIAKATGRVIIGTFSSQVERVKWVIYAAAKLGKKVALDGYSMKMNVEIAKELGYITIPKGTLIDVKDIESYPDNNVVVICTGAQGEDNAVLMRIVNKTHRFLSLRTNDTVVFSSSIIPGNERTIQRLKDNIYRQCDNVIHGDIMDVHISG
ncbi:MAG: ribonuclease J, partial [Candidatus Magasanikbacteria bacterium]|nr:ribonuclease J [Candidatus Magasanikbacteria bacterium]